MKKKILILNDYYFPGYKGGGPIQSCENLVANLSDIYDFYVLCSDRDLTDQKPYSNVKVNDWNEVNHAKVFYMSPSMQNMKGFKKILNETEYDILYLNGFFSFKFTIVPLILKKFHWICEKTVILSPRGHLGDNCYNHKPLKKHTYLNLAKLLGLYNNIIWHATSKLEENDIKKRFPNANVFEVSNLSQKIEIKELKKEKKVGQLNMVFLSRIAPRKNLAYALSILKNIKEGNVTLDIYGPIEDKDYWNECLKLINGMPENIKVNYCGEIEHDKISDMFQKYHAFFFPTLGENYGHVIIEAMMNQCLCILSKQVTPWDSYINLLNIGGELEKDSTFIQSIHKLLAFNQDDFSKAIHDNNEFVKKHFSNDDCIKKYIDLFNEKGI